MLRGAGNLLEAGSSGLAFSAAGDVIYENDTAETSLCPTDDGAGSLIVTPDDLQYGTVIELLAFGKFVSNGTSKLGFTIYAGEVLLATLMPADVDASGRWLMQAWLVCQDSSETSGEFRVFAQVSLESRGVVSIYHLEPSSEVLEFDPSVEQLVDLRATWDTADAGNVLTRQHVGLRVNR